MSEEYQKLKQKAMNLLARREHAIAELRQKLSRNEDGNAMVETLLAELMEDNYLNERRYVEMIVRTRYSRGHGPLRIRQELRMHRVPDSLVNEVLEAFDGDWFELAKAVREKKFGDWEVSRRDDQQEQYKARAKQMRFLASRGFSTDQIECAF